MTYPVNYVCSNTVRDLNLRVFSMITGFNESKTLTTHNHGNVNVDFMEKNIIQINDEITINGEVSVKKVMYVKRLCLESCYM